MIREQRARWLAVGSAAVVVALAGVFALLRNAPAPPGGAPGAPAASSSSAGVDSQADAIAADRVAAGRAGFEGMNCTGCHLLAGVGNPTYPLDGVGSRLDRVALRNWTLGVGPAAEGLSARVVARKRANADDPRLDEVLDLLESSR